MQINLTNKEFRRLLDLVYIGNWVLNSTRGNDRFEDYDNLESKIFALSPALSEVWDGTIVPSRAYAEGGIHEAIAYYEDNVFYEILAEELSRRELSGDHRRKLRRNHGQNAAVYGSIPNLRCGPADVGKRVIAPLFKLP